MRKISLCFFDSELENEFQSVNKSFMIKKFYLFYRMQIIFMLLMLVITVFRENFSTLIVCSLLGLLFFIFINFLLKKWLKMIFETIIVLVFSLIGLVFVEILKTAMLKDLYLPSSLMITLAFGFYITLLLLSRASWIFCSVVYIFNFAYLSFRIFDPNYLGTLPESIVGSILLIISFCVIAYTQEKTNREYFKKLRDSNENLKQFKVVVQSILPSSVFIANYSENKLEFINKNAEFFLSKNNQIKRAITDEYDEKIKFMTFSAFESNERRYVNGTIEGLEEILDDFKILETNEQKESDIKMSEILRKFAQNKLINNENLLDSRNMNRSENMINSDYNNRKLNKENINNLDDNIQKSILDNESLKFSSSDFITIHISNKSLDPDLTITEIQAHEISFSNKIYYEVKIARIIWDGKPCLFIILNDNTNSKRIIELINLDRYKNQMLATVSHDLRTPLNGVIGMMNTVLTNITDKETKKNLNLGIRSANLLNFLINDILDFSQISYKKLRLNVERINLKEMISEIFNLMKTQAKMKKLDFSWENDSKENEVIYSDSNRVKQILLNLIGNAIKFTNKGYITLRVEKIEENHSRIFKFSVEDSGIGIKEEDISKLFVLFGKLKQENPEINKTGIGFGLTISNTLAKMLYSGTDAGIFVKSKYGQGSNFYFKIDGGSEDLENFSFIEEKVNEIQHDSVVTRLSRYDSSISLDKSFTRESKTFLPNSREFETSQNLNVKKLLVVDDDAINILILTKYLEFFKLDYLTAMNGAEAIDVIESEIIIKNNEISAILMDCNMPIMDGFQATEKIIELLLNNNKKEIPIIAITANVTNADLDLCLKSGMKKFLPKPVRRKDLGLVLQKMFQIKLPLE